MQWRGMVAPLLATIVLALTCASGHGAPFLRASSPLGPDCPELSGWPRLLELYAGHWDVVNLVALASPHEDAVVEAQRAVLCAAPLALNEYGVEPLVECKEGWYDPATRECAGGLYAGVTGSGSPNGPAWKRFDHGRRTRLYSRDTVPSVANVQRVSNQHDSDTLRPADVSVYVQQGVGVGMGGGGALANGNTNCIATAMMSSAVSAATMQSRSSITALFVRLFFAGIRCREHACACANPPSPSQIRH
jgi:hypothetical protein